MCRHVRGGTRFSALGAFMGELVHLADGDIQLADALILLPRGAGRAGGEFVNLPGLRYDFLKTAGNFVANLRVA